MIGKGVWVVTGLELGWDCLVGVYDASVVSEEELMAQFDEESYVIHHKVIKGTVES